jgi:N-hydroxyarylamine O-acetyltransferase
MHIERTLERIAYSGSLDVNAEVLTALQRAFLFSVPFENLDIHANVPITLEPERFYQKIVENRRGGFCYECNSLFYQLLLRLGFDVHIIAARMTLRDINSMRYSHMALLVNLDRPYLVDVGNGQSVHVPMPVPGDGVTEAEQIDYRIGQFDEQEYALYFRNPGAEWMPRFVFSTTPRRLQEFAAMCTYHQTSPESIFVKQRLCTLPTPTGRITLAGNQLSIRDKGTEVTSTLATAAEMQQILQQYFNIKVSLAELS